VTVASSRDHRLDQLAAREGLAVKHFSDDLAKGFQLLGRDAEVPLPTGSLPRSAGGDQRKEHAGILGREQVQRPSHGPGLDDPTLAQSARYLAGFRGLAPHANTELRIGRDLRLDAAQTADDRCHRPIAHWIEEMPAHPPCERLRPGHFRRHRREGSASERPER
jgi:hypothetical protein